MSLLDDLLKHKIFVQRLTKKTAQDMYKALLAAKRHLITTDTDTYTYKQYKTLQRQLQDKLNNGVSGTLATLNAFAAYELRFINRLLNKHGIIDTTVGQIVDVAKVAVKTSLGKSEALPIDTAYKIFVDKKSEDMVNAAKDNKDKNTAVDLLVAGMITTQLLSLTNIALNSVSNAQKEDVYTQADIKQVQWVATLDDSTCAYCDDLDGTLFELSDTPDCPAHANCRCELVPYEE